MTVEVGQQQRPALRHVQAHSMGAALKERRAWQGKRRGRQAGGDEHASGMAMAGLLTLKEVRVPALEGSTDCVPGVLVYSSLLKTKRSELQPVRSGQTFGQTPRESGTVQRCHAVKLGMFREDFHGALAPASGLNPSAVKRRAAAPLK